MSGMATLSLVARFLEAHQPIGWGCTCGQATTSPADQAAHQAVVLNEIGMLWDEAGS